jgi:hypothetical protein
MQWQIGCTPYCLISLCPKLGFFVYRLLNELEIFTFAITQKPDRDNQLLIRIMAAYLAII